MVEHQPESQEKRPGHALNLSVTVNDKTSTFLFMWMWKPVEVERPTFGAV
jgi:hypothetical protein